MGLASSDDLRTEPDRKPKTFRTAIRNFFEEIWRPDRKLTVVCIPPGAGLILKGIPADLRKRYGVACEESVRFVQMSAQVNMHRDAFQFGNGRVVCIQELPEGLRAEVVSLDRPAADTERSAPFEETAVLSVRG